MQQTTGPREQINQASSFLDASQIYGTTRKRVEELRLFQGGLLRTQAGPGGELLPSDGSSMYCKSTAGNLRLPHIFFLKYPIHLHTFTSAACIFLMMNTNN